MIEALKTIRRELSRLSWPTLAFLVASLVAFGIIGISRANLEVILFKFLVFCPALVLVHLSRTKLFPYIDLSSLYDETTPQDDTDDEGPSDLGFALKDVAFIIGTFAYYIGMTYILVSAI